jgi:hypothetical protein
MNIELFTAFVLITIVLIITRGPDRHAHHFDRGNPRFAGCVDDGRRDDARQRLVAFGDSVGARLGARAYGPFVRGSALDRRGLSRLARRASVAACGRGRSATGGDRTRSVRAGPAGRAVESQDDRLLHRLPAAIRRPASAGGAAAGRDVRRIGLSRRGVGFRLGRRVRPRTRMVHAARASEIARQTFRNGFDRRRAVAFLGETPELTVRARRREGNRR